MRTRSDSWRCWIPAALLAVLGMATVGIAQALPGTAAKQPVAVFTWQGDALASVIAAGGRVLSPGGLPGSIIAIGDAPDFTSRLYAAGASLVLRADAALGCSAERIGS
jgi:hypothetical protein